MKKTKENNKIFKVFTNILNLGLETAVRLTEHGLADHMNDIRSKREDQWNVNLVSRLRNRYSVQNWTKNWKFSTFTDNAAVTGGYMTMIIL